MKHFSTFSFRKNAFSKCPFLLAGLLLTFAFPSEGWASSHSTHTHMISVTCSGSGKIYASTSSAEDVNQYKSTFSDSWDCGSSSSGIHVKTYYLFARPNDGYYFTGWSGNLTSSTAVGQSTGEIGGENNDNYSYAASFSAISVVGLADAIYANPSTLVNEQVRFQATGADARDDFYEPSFTSSAGGTWKIDNWDVAEGFVTVYYTYTPSEVGEFDAVLTLTTKSSNSGTANIHAIVEALAENDAVRLYANGDKIADSEGNLADVLAAAQAGETVQLLRNVESISSALTIARSITIDLNAKTISGTANNLLTINGSGIEVTIKDSKSGGAISVENSLAGDLVAIKLTSGSLLLQKGNINVSNTSTDADKARAFGVDIAAGTEFVMNGGYINSTCSSTHGTYGIYQRGTSLPSTFTMNGGTIYAHAAQCVRGIIAYGKVELNDGSTIMSDGASDAIGVLVHQSGTLGSGDFTMNGGVVSGTTTGVQVTNNTCVATINSGSVQGETNAVKLAASGITGVVIKGGMFSGDIVHSNNKFLKGGYYTAQPAAAAIATNYLSYPTLEGTAIYSAGYLYGVGGNEEGAIICRIVDGSTNLFVSSLAAALDYANQNDTKTITIILMADHVLPKGYYKLPANATLLIPYKADQTSMTWNNTDKYYAPDIVKNANAATPSVFRTLTLADEAHLDAYGRICLGGVQNRGAQGATGAGIPGGKYGKLHLNAKGDITLQNGSHLAAFGFVTGEGNIDARSGASVYEMFQVFDWKGGSAMLFGGLASNSNKVFPVYSYFVQNVESKVTYHPGSNLYAHFALDMSGDYEAPKIHLVGTSNAMFLMDEEDESEDTWVRKSYDAITDQQVYDINSSASLGSLRIKVSSYDMESSNFALPITNNMKIHLLTGDMYITQDAEMFPGSEIEIDKEATAHINNGKYLYIYDDAEWAVGDDATNTSKPTVGKGGYCYSLQWSGKIKYTASRNGAPVARTKKDAELNIHGTFDVNGYILTSPTGANIRSTNADAGKIKFTNATARAEDNPLQRNNFIKLSGSSFYTKIVYGGYMFTSAKLRNTDQSFATTYGATAGTEYGFYKDKWVRYVSEGCFAKDNYDRYYANPGDYVQITSNVEDANHLYHSAEDSRQFILMDDCQWWAVEQTEEDDAVYYCADNDTYYYYNTTTGKWAEKTLTVTWTNFDGSTVATYDNVPFGGKPKYLGTNPTRPASTYYTYSFAGWLPEITDDTKLYENATYVAQYEQHEIRYTVTFKDENGKTIETQYVKVGDVPVCSFQPTKQGYYLYWKTDDVNQYPISAVSGNITYKAYYELIPKTTFTILFQNYNGTVLQSFPDVKEGTKPAYTGETPTKPESKDKVYSFIGWTPDVVPATQDMTYVAKFAESPRLYTIIFQDINGVEIERHSLGYGEIPVCDNVPTKAPTAEFYYTVRWDSNIAAVTGDKTYRVADFDAHKNTLRLTVAAGANGSVAVTKEAISQELSAIYDYGTELVVTATPSAHYQFKQWSDGNFDNPRTITLTEPKNIQAQFELVKETITWKVDEQVIATSQVDYGTVPTYTGATPNKPSICGFYFTFAGWSPAFTAATSAQTYTAQFNKIANPSLIAYQLAFDGNGATSGSMPNQGFDAGVSQKIDANKFVNARTVTFNYNGNGQAVEQQFSSKAFTGWSDGENNYSDGQMVTDLADDCDEVITLYAQWSDSYSQVKLPTPAKSIQGYTFTGWYDAATDGNKIGDAGASYTATGDVTLHAQWAPVGLGDYLDIVDWTSNSLTINMNGSSQKITIGTTTKNKNDRETNRTMVFSGLSLAPGDGVLIAAHNNTTDALESSHTYKVPYIYTGTDINPSTTDEVWVKSGTWTVSGDKTIAKLVVCPGAEVNVASGTLTITGDLVLRTTPWKSAAISGTFTAGHTYYTRIISASDAYYQFGLPLASGIDEVFLSNGTISPYGNTWLLKSYDGANRAVNGATGNNWDAVADHSTIAANVGYEMFSNSKYYREFYFPVNPGDLTSNTVAAHAYPSAQGAQHQGWNALVAPSMSRWYIDYKNPEEAKKVSELVALNEYWQHAVTEDQPMQPALPFYYQNMRESGDETLTIISLPESAEGSPLAPRRAAEEDAVQTQWLRLNYADADGQKDETNIYVHPTKFTTDFEPQYDVYKITKSGSRPLIYTQLDCGDLAFAAIPDNAQLQMLPLAVFSPVAGEYTFSLAKNRFLTRMANVWIFDTQSATIIDLLQSDYTVQVGEGTTASRFYLMGKFRAPQTPTDLDEINQDGQDDSDAPRKIIYDQHMYILYHNHIWDANGRLIK